MTYEKLRKFLKGNEKTTTSYFNYMRKKILVISSITQTNSLLNFYYYKLQIAEGKDPINILTSIASGKS